jgi:hypothetical protein
MRVRRRSGGRTDPGMAARVSTSDERPENEQTAPGSPHHRGRSLSPSHSPVPRRRALHHPEALLGLGDRAQSNQRPDSQTGGPEASRLTLDPPLCLRTCTATWWHALARSRARPPANKSGRLPPGGRAGHRPHCWTGYQTERLRKSSRYVGSVGGSRLARRSSASSSRCTTSSLRISSSRPDGRPASPNH